MVTLRRRIAVIRADRHISTGWVKDKDIRRDGGSQWVEVEKAKYDWTGPFYSFSYRLVRSVGAREYLGVQRIYLEGNPTPYEFREDDKMAALSGVAEDVAALVDSDLPLKLMRPRKVDLVLLILVGVVGLAIGAIVGMRFAG